MRVFCVYGPPAAGKTSYVQEHKQPNDLVIERDNIFEAFGADRFSTDPGVTGVAAAARFAAVGRVLDSLKGVKDPFSFDVWMTRTYVPQNVADDWAAAGVEFILVDPGLEETLRRAEADNRPAEQIEAIHAWYADPPTVKEQKVKYKALSLPSETTVVEETETGVFEAYAAVFNNIDSYGDVIRKGAFAESLAEYAGAGVGVPVYWGHRMDDPNMNIGRTISAVEDDHGLKVRVQLDLDSANGKQVYKLLQEKRVSQMSFAYDVLDASWTKVDGMEVYELRKLKLHEVSVVPIGANQATEILSVKNGTPQTSRGERDEAPEQVEEPAESETEEPETVKADESEVKASNERGAQIEKIITDSVVNQYV